MELRFHDFEPSGYIKTYKNGLQMEFILQQSLFMTGNVTDLWTRFTLSFLLWGLHCGIAILIKWGGEISGP